MLHIAVYIAYIPQKGRGIFTPIALEPGTIVETSPVIVMSHKDRLLLDQTLLHDYIFEWQPNGENLCCMALGYIPLYNHSYNSNCEYFMNYDDQTMFIKTVARIEAGSELTINYNGDFDDETPVWFEAE